MGAKVIAAASNDAKLQICRQNGADEVINYGTRTCGHGSKPSPLARSGRLYDPVWRPYSEPALRDMAWNGRFPGGRLCRRRLPKVPLNLTLLKGCSIVGCSGRIQRNEPERNRRKQL